MKTLKHANLYVALNTYIRMLEQMMRALPPGPERQALRLELLMAVYERRKYKRAYTAMNEALKPLNDFLMNPDIDMETVKACHAWGTWYRFLNILERQTL